MLVNKMQAIKQSELAARSDQGDRTTKRNKAEANRNEKNGTKTKPNLTKPTIIQEKRKKNGSATEIKFEKKQGKNKTHSTTDHTSHPITPHRITPHYTAPHHLLPSLLSLHFLELVVVSLVLVHALVIQVQNFLAHAVQEILIVRNLPKSDAHTKKKKKKPRYHK